MGGTNNGEKGAAWSLIRALPVFTGKRYFDGSSEYLLVEVGVGWGLVRGKCHDV